MLSNFYSFGSLLPGRKWEPTSTDKYRFGFNGKEKDDEIYGEGNAMDFGDRLFDSRIARWLSLDKCFGKYPRLSPYTYTANNPLLFIDPDGKELRFVGEIDETQFKQFKETIESRFNGLVIIDKVPGKKSQQWSGTFDKKGNPVMIPYNYQMVTMKINEERLELFAIAMLPENASPDEIAAKKAEIRQELLGNESYKQLDAMIKSPIVATYQFSNSEFGSYTANTDGTGKPNGQGINMNNISYYDKVPEIGSYSILIHEIIEGFGYYSAKADRNNKSADKLTYGVNHLKALIGQCKDLGIDYISNETDPNSDNPGSHVFKVGGTISVSLYKRLSNSMYQKTIITITIDEKGSIVPTEGADYSSKTEVIKSSQFKKEKKYHESKL
jgi:RHS repeat-associated protein